MAEGRTAYEVDPDGWYVEPEEVTTWLLARELFPGPIWDPACGQGNILRVCQRRGLEVKGSDIVDRTKGQSWFLGTIDFLMTTTGPKAGSIITNPPYGRALLAEAFIRRAIAWPGVERVAAFVNAKFLFSAGRSTGLFSETPPARVYPVWPRPSCPPGAELAAGRVIAQGGVENYAWLVWDTGSIGRTIPRIIWKAP